MSVVAVHLIPKGFDSKGIFSDEERAQLFDDRVYGLGIDVSVESFEAALGFDLNVVVGDVSGRRRSGFISIGCRTQALINVIWLNLKLLVQAGSIGPRSRCFYNVDLIDDRVLSRGLSKQVLSR